MAAPATYQGTHPAPGWYPDPQGMGEGRWWDGTQWTTAVRYSGGIPAGMRWRRTRGLARATALLMILTAFAHGAAIVAFRDRYTTIERFIDLQVGPKAIEDSDGRVVAAILMLAAIALPAYIVWIVWFRASYRNAETFRRVRFRRWAVAGWLVPVFTLFRPKQLVDDLWMAGERRFDAHTKPAGLPGLVQLWWFTTLGAQLVGSAGYGMTRALPEADPKKALETLQLAANVIAVSHLLWIVAMVTGAFLALRATERLEARHSERNAPPSTATALPVT